MLSPSMHQQPSGLYQRQLESVRQMLSLNESGGLGGPGGVDPQWKVLVYDQVNNLLMTQCQS